MVKLKDILLETKFGYLVEADKKTDKKFPARNVKSGKIVYYKSKEAMDNAIKAGKSEPVDKKKDTKTTDKSKKPGKPVDDKPTSKKDQEKTKKAAEKKERKELEKIKKAKVVVREPGKPDKEISIEDILPEPFGNAKDDSHPQSKQAKQKVYDMYQERYEKEGKTEIKKRLKNKDKNGDPILSKEEQALYEKEVEDIKKENEENKNEDWYEKKEIPNKSTFLANKIRDDYKKKADYFDPDGAEWGNTNNYWNKDEDDDDPFGDWGEDDDDWDDDDWGEKSVDAYGEKLSSKRGGKEQQQAMEIKLRIPVGNLKKIKQDKNHYVTNEDGNKVPVTVFQDPKTGKYHAVDDEGNIYENDTTDFTKAKPTGDLGGYPGGQTKVGKKISDKRQGKDTDEDDYEKTTFADLLSMLSLGAYDDIDWTDPLSN